MEELSRYLLDQTPDAIVIEDSTGRVLNCNSAASVLFQTQRDVLIGGPLSELIRDAANTYGSDTEDESALPYESQVLMSDGRRIPVHIRKSRIRYNSHPALLWKIRDVSSASDNGHVRSAQCTGSREEEKSAEDRARGVHRMEAIGRLAGGVAHDFNNLLTVILGRCEMLMHRLAPEHQLTADVALIYDAADKAAAVTRQLLAFGRGQMLQPEVLNLNDVVNSMKPIVHSLMSGNVRLSLDLGADVRCVEADRSQMEQVIMNLIVNAIDAMTTGGELHIWTENERLKAHNPGFGFPANAGVYSVLSVRDTGSGIAQENLKHIFEPFFTTKNSVGGSGLGLSTVYGIVKQSGGYIRAVSEPGEGSTFKVYLPGVEGSESSASKEASDASSGSETILIVEDNTVVRQLTRELLENRGYVVVEAANGEEALHLCKTYTGKIALMLSDVVMPGMTGHTLATEALRLRPDMKVLLMSGFADEITRSQIMQTGYPFLAKPFTSSGLGKKVREVLDGSTR